MASSHPKTVDGIDWKEVDGGMVVYHPIFDTVHYLNPSGAFIVELCNGEHSELEIASIVQAFFQLPEPPLTEVQDMIALARAEGLVVG